MNKLTITDLEVINEVVVAIKRLNESIDELNELKDDILTMNSCGETIVKAELYSWHERDNVKDFIMELSSADIDLLINRKRSEIEEQKKLLSVYEIELSE